MEGVRKPVPPIISDDEREKYIRLKYEKKLLTKDSSLSLEEALEQEHGKDSAVSFPARSCSQESEQRQVLLMRAV